MNENKKNIARWILTILILGILLIGSIHISKLTSNMDIIPFSIDYENSFQFRSTMNNSIDTLLFYLEAVEFDESELRQQNLKNQLEDEAVLYYYSNKSGKVYSNIPNATKDSKIQDFSIDGVPYYSFETGSDYPDNESDFLQEGFYNHHFPEGLEGKIFMSYTKEAFDRMNAQWRQLKYESNWAMKIALLCAATILILMIPYTLVLFRDKHISFFTNFYSELYVVFFIIITFFAGVSGTQLRLYNSTMYNQVLTGSVIFIYFTFVFVLYTILIRKIASETLFKRSLIYAMGSPLLKSKNYESLDAVEKLKTRTFGFISISIGLILIYFIFWLSLPLLFCLEIFLVYFYSKGNEDLYEQVKEEEKENLQKMNRADLQRVELITNVSHDLKTPLTSIISYSDLMQHEEDPIVLKEYAKVIETKSKQLSTIIVDLFELAKTSSGNAEVHMESIRFDALIEQTIADMRDEIVKANRQVKVKLPKNPVWILSDGARLRRVLDNLIVNCLKYSLEKTRIYVTLSVENHKSILKIINTSSYEMTFTKEDILSRFYRADESRSKDGNGLGLSIAESFTTISGGEFDIEILGDQFVSVLRFPIQQQNTQTETDEQA